jgi:metallo-beta-lactamase class B
MLKKPPRFCMLRSALRLRFSAASLSYDKAFEELAKRRFISMATICYDSAPSRRLARQDGSGAIDRGLDSRGNLMRLTCAWLLVAVSLSTASSAASRLQEAGKAYEPFRVIGNIYFVGGLYGSYLITTPQGHILLDTGSAEMHNLVVSNIEKLGFNVRDIRIMVSSHAHWDHVEGHAAMRRVTGAQVVALGGDAVALRSGRDNSAIGARNFEPVAVDRVIEDGETVTLDGVTLRALWTSGHTQGATMWMTTVQEGGRTYSVAFRGGEIPNAGAPLFDNPRHPTVVADTRRTLQRLKALTPPDLFLHNHPQDPPQRLNPALPVDGRCATCFDAEGFRRYVEAAEASFDAMLREAEARRQK